MSVTRQPDTAVRNFGAAVVVAIIVCLGLLGFGSWYAGSGRFDYLLWNLFLAVVPLLFALKLRQVLRRKAWSDWEPLGWTIAWLLFLPNSFYMISDYIHLREVSAAHVLYNSVLFTAFIYLGALLGFCSLYSIHRELRRRLTAEVSSAIIGGTLVLCSFAIYIGRDLRWNSWDVLVSPFGLLFDISDRLLRPDEYPHMFVTIIIFSALLSSLYAVFWTGGRLLQRSAHD